MRDSERRISSACGCCVLSQLDRQELKSGQEFPSFFRAMFPYGEWSADRDGVIAVDDLIHLQA